jgi:hypothetical protein
MIEFWTEGGEWECGTYSCTELYLVNAGDVGEETTVQSVQNSR